MKRLLTLAVVATLLIAGSASAQWGRHPVAQPNATFAFGGAGIATGPSTTNNDDSCDIGVTPAATLLLPYFEVETASRGTETFFTIVNTSQYPTIAHVTIWTDWSFPVLDFNVFLTGYDVQAISLYDIIVNKTIAAAGPGTSSDVTIGKGNGGRSGGTTIAASTNPNITAANLAACVNQPGVLRDDIAAAVKNALVTGVNYSGNGFGCNSKPGLAAGSTITPVVGSPASTHTTPTTAVGYVTVDVAAACNQYLPTDPNYYSSATGILFDNTLTGDYEIFNKAAGSNYAGGNPLVHIRAIPEGGAAGVALAGAQTNFPYTFYSRYNNETGAAAAVYAPVMNRDRRQPLPSVWAARWIAGGTPAMTTNYRIWREGVTGPVAGAATTVAGSTGFVFSTPTDCGFIDTTMGANSPTISGVAANSALPVRELVRFDEHENFLTNLATGCNQSPCPTSSVVTTPESSNPGVPAPGASAGSVPLFPTGTYVSGDTAGWMYMNLDQDSVPAVPNPPNANTITFPATTVGAFNSVAHPTMAARASQSWVVVSLAGAGSTAGQYSVDFDATWLGNGCTGPVAPSKASVAGGGVIGPAPNATP